MLQRLVEARSGRGSPAVDGKDGSRPVHLAATGTIRRSACCSSMTRTAHGPVISLPGVPQEVSVQQCLVEARWRWRSCRRRTWR